MKRLLTGLLAAMVLAGLLAFLQPKPDAVIGDGCDAWYSWSIFCLI